MRWMLFLVLLTLGIEGFSQAGMWTWMNGDSVPNNWLFPDYDGPGDRYACGYWTDTAGNFWIYGGVPNARDLWKFDPLSNVWTMARGGMPMYVINAPRGVYSPLNEPGSLSYGMFTWTTPDNHLWLFGGYYSYDYIISDNLWQYDPAINQWAWMGGFGSPNYGTKGVGSSSTRPGGRNEGNCTWVDAAGNLWLFGGTRGQFAFEERNDVWNYNRSNGRWTWMSGSNMPNHQGSYGSIGVPSPNYFPSARSSNLFWKDAVGDFWLGGGGDFADGEMHQDIWKFSPSTMEWTQILGWQDPDTSHAIGANCMESSSNNMGPRYENRAKWNLCNELIICYGGVSSLYGATSPVNDMWAYHVNQNNWEKISSGSANGNFGTMGVAHSQNYPHQRGGAVGFVDRNNNLWMFGGMYEDSIRAYYLSDMWKYVVDVNCVGSFSCQNNLNCNMARPSLLSDRDTICGNDSTQICAPAGYSEYIWSTGDVERCIYVNEPGGYIVTVTGTNNCTIQSNILTISAHIQPPVSISVNGDTLSSFGATSYQWYLNGTKIEGATNAIYIANEPGSYTLEITDGNGCTAMSTPVLISGVNEIESEAINIYPNPSFAGCQLSVTNGLVGGNLEVYDANGRLVFQSVIRNPHSEINLPFPSGVYFIRIYSEKASVVQRWVRL